jgi:hypothetical protein
LSSLTSFFLGSESEASPVISLKLPELVHRRERHSGNLSFCFFNFIFWAKIRHFAIFIKKVPSKMVKGTFWKISEKMVTF